MSPQRAKAVGIARKRGAPPPPPAKAPRRLDLYHMLSAVVGAYVGLVFYSVITPGMIVRGGPATPTPDPRQQLSIERLSSHITAAGLLAIDGTVHNNGDRSCSLAILDVQFIDGQNQELARVPTTLDAIPAGGNQHFEVHAAAKGAVDGRVTVDLAQF